MADESGAGRTAEEDGSSVDALLCTGRWRGCQLGGRRQECSRSGDQPLRTCRKATGSRSSTRCRIASNASGSKVAGLRGHHMAPSAQDAQILRRIIAEQAGQPASGSAPSAFLLYLDACPGVGGCGRRARLCVAAEFTPVLRLRPDPERLCSTASRGHVRDRTSRTAGSHVATGIPGANMTETISLPIWVVVVAGALVTVDGARPPASYPAPAGCSAGAPVG